MIRRPPRSTRSTSSAASDVYKRQFWWFVFLPESPMILIGQCIQGHTETWTLMVSAFRAIPKPWQSTTVYGGPWRDHDIHGQCIQGCVEYMTCRKSCKNMYENAIMKQRSFCFTVLVLLGHLSVFNWNCSFPTVEMWLTERQVTLHLYSVRGKSLHTLLSHPAVGERQGLSHGMLTNRQRLFQSESICTVHFPATVPF